MADFKTFPAAPLTLSLAGETLELSPIRLGELPRFLERVRPMLDTLAAGGVSEPEWALLLMGHGDAFLDLLALTSRRERAWIDALSLDEAVQLAAAVFEVNADFFVSHVVPSIQNAAEHLAPVLSTLGTTRSHA